MKNNIKKFPEFCSFLAELGVDELTFNQLGGYDRPEFYDNNRLLLDSVKELFHNLPGIKENLLKKGLLIHGSTSYLDRIVLTTEDKKNPIEECNPGTWFWFINENGYISPCSYTSYEYKYSTKNLQSPTDIEQVETYFRELRKSEPSKWCSDCYCTQVYDKFE